MNDQNLPTLTHKLLNEVKKIKGIKALVLGGSQATNSARPDSDFDFGLFYADDSPPDIPSLRRLADTWNDFPKPVVTEIGGWGRWVNGGCWLTIEGQRVDFLYRSLDFVSAIVDECLKGKIQTDYYQQPAYGFYSHIYLAETKICKILYDPLKEIGSLKKKVEQYPQPLKETIVNGFLWDAQFTLGYAKKSAQRSEVYVVAGSLTRIVNDLIQVIYALNETYFLTEKRFLIEEKNFGIKPDSLKERAQEILGHVGTDQIKLAEQLAKTENLFNETKNLCGKLYQPKYTPEL